MNRFGLSLLGLVGLLLSQTGCPTVPSQEFIPGGTGDNATLGATPSVRVLSPLSDLSIAGGTPVEVTWNLTATTNFASVNVVFDPDTDATNGNEITAQRGLGITTFSALLDTSRLPADTYNIGVILIEQNEIAAFGYAPGRLIVNQQATFFFDSPRDNFVFDRTEANTPRFDVAWQLRDPDSTVKVRILLDPDGVPNNNEFLLRESDDQDGDSFSFDLPTIQFPAGTYRIVAIVDDGIRETAFYAPGTIRLLNRLAGVIDLRNLGAADSDIPGAVFQGFNPFDNAGSTLRSAGDIDGDGRAEMMVVAQFGKPQYRFGIERTGLGEAYLIYGRQERFNGEIALNSVGSLLRGEAYGGPPAVFDPIRPSRGITSFAVLSDWDGDTIPEIAFGMPFTDSEGILVSTTDNLDRPTLDADGYFRSGAVVIASSSSLRPDLGFPGGNVFNLAEFGTLPQLACPPAEAGCPHTFYGPKAPSAQNGGAVTLFNRYVVCWVPPTTPRGGLRLGCRLSSNETLDFFGESISAFAYDSILISAPNRNSDVSVKFDESRPAAPALAGAGVISLFFCGVSEGFFPWDTTAAPPGGGDFPAVQQTVDANLIPHSGPYHYTLDDFQRVAGIGAAAGVGTPAFVVDPDNGDPCGMGFSTFLRPGDYTTRILGKSIGGRLGGAVGIDDFNGDGQRDFLIGYPFANEGAGNCFIVFGRLRDLIRGGELGIDELALPSNALPPGSARIFDGIRVVGSPGTRLGQSQDRAGDFNGDGLPDVVIGSPLTSNRKGGVAVLYGSRTLINQTETEIPFDEIPQRGLGVIFTGQADEDFTGARVAGAGDIDGDGLDDILIAAPNRSVRLDVNGDGEIDIDRTECGVVYLVYGSARLTGTLSLADIGTTTLPGAMFVGRNSGDFLGAGFGEQGDRSNGIASAGDVDGDGSPDLLMSAVRASPRGRNAAGEAYLIYNRPEVP